MSNVFNVRGENGLTHYEDTATKTVYLALDGDYRDKINATKYKMDVMNKDIKYLKYRLDNFESGTVPETSLKVELNPSMLNEAGDGVYVMAGSFNEFVGEIKFSSSKVIEPNFVLTTEPPLHVQMGSAFDGLNILSTFFSSSLGMYLAIVTELNSGVSYSFYVIVHIVIPEIEVPVEFP